MPACAPPPLWLWPLPYLQHLGSAVLGLSTSLITHAKQVVDAFAKEQTRKVNSLNKALVHNLIDVVDGVVAAATLDTKRTQLIEGSLAKVRRVWRVLGWSRG
jgi:hypothetical protein